MSPHAPCHLLRVICNADALGCTGVTGFCQTDGTCTEATGKCVCEAGFTGERCETLSNCFVYAATVFQKTGQLISPCNNGTCPIPVDSAGATCVCSPGTTGSRCELDTNECLNNPCKNSATCNDGFLSFTCSCRPGFAGQLCEVNLDDCVSLPCKNGGTCVDGVASFNCTCLPGTTGLTCQTNIDECSPNPCANGGTCTDLFNAYTCSCPTGTSGSRCQTRTFRSLIQVDYRSNRTSSNMYTT